MRTRSIYKQSRGRHQAVAFFDNKESGYQYSFLNYYDAPTPMDAYNVQKNIMKLKCQKAKSSGIKDIIDSINEELENKGKYGKDIGSDTILKLEQSLGSWQYNKDPVFRDTTLTRIMALNKENQLLVSEFDASVSKLEKTLKGMKKEKNDEHLLKEINSLADKIDILRKNNQNALPSSTFKDIKTITKKADGTKEESSMLNSLKGIGNRIKGRQFELEVMAFIKKYLNVIPDSIEAVDTAWVLEDGKQLGSDVFFIDKALIVKIGNEEMTLQNWLTNIKKLNNISQIGEITQEDLDVLKQALVTGVNVKSGWTQLRKPFNITGYSIDTLLYEMWQTHMKDRGSSWRALNLFRNLYQEPNANKAFKKSITEFYDIYNYLLAHRISEVMGDDNGIVVTRKGFSFIDDFITTSNMLKAQKTPKINMFNTSSMIKIIFGKM